MAGSELSSCSFWMPNRVVDAAAAAAHIILAWIFLIVVQTFFPPPAQGAQVAFICRPISHELWTGKFTVFLGNIIWLCRGTTNYYTETKIMKQHAIQLTCNESKQDCWTGKWPGKRKCCWRVAHSLMPTLYLHTNKFLLTLQMKWGSESFEKAPSHIQRHRSCRGLIQWCLR